MATIRQKKLAKAAVENIDAVKPLNKQDLVVSVGYSELSGEKKATEILQSKGVQKELKILGFDEQTAKEVVSSILKNEDEESKDRLKAAEMVFKVHGSFKESEIPPEKSNTSYTFIFNAETQSEIRKIEATIKEKLLHHVPQENN